MTWDSIQQLVRIVLYAIGGYLFGESVADGELYQGVISGVLGIGAFVWWWVWNRDRSA
jgi:membrane protein DedA with SNARE-associated domain